MSLFNGQDLTGWGFPPTSEADKESARKWKASDPNAPPWPIIDAPVSFDGQVSSSDGRFVAKSGRLVVATPPEGRRIQQLATTKSFSKDFILRLEFRATPNADSGIFIRANNSSAATTCWPAPTTSSRITDRGDWNEIEVEVHGRTAFCQCNGEVLETAMKVPADGPIGLEGDRGQMEYRRIRLEELP